MVEQRTKGDFAGFKRMSWGAIFAGTAAALVIYFLLNLLGLAIGFGTIDPAAANPLEGLGVGAVIWWIVATIAALFFGGWLSGRVAGVPFVADSVIHGFVTFSLFTIVSMYLLTTGLGAILSGVGGLVGQAMDVAAGEGLDILGVAEGAAPEVTEEEARQIAVTAADAISRGALYAFLALMLGGVAALLGGWVGTPRRAPVAETTDRRV
jgi:hypothetical protein